MAVAACSGMLPFVIRGVVIPIDQPVIDFFVEPPLIWGAYTYHIQVQPYGSEARVSLYQVVRN